MNIHMNICMNIDIIIYTNLYKHLYKYHPLITRFHPASGPHCTWLGGPYVWLGEVKLSRALLSLGVVTIPSLTRLGGPYLRLG